MIVSHGFDGPDYAPADGRACVDGGGRAIVLTHPLCRRMAADPAVFKKLRREFAGYGLVMSDAHAPYGEDWDLNAPEPSTRAEMIRRQVSLLELLGGSGIQTCTMHIGWCYGGTSVAQNREHVRASLEQLVPAAERTGIILNIENIYYPTTDPAELLWQLDYFKHPNLGVTYDSGHAILMGEGVTTGRVSPHIRSFWASCEDALDRQKGSDAGSILRELSPYITTAHLHDNDGHGDWHDLPGRGIGRWDCLIRQLLECPNLRTIQSEVHYRQLNIPVSEVCACFETLLKGTP